MSNTDFSEQWKSMQQMFLLNFHHSESMRENARRFWENQNKILDNMEAFTSNWFKRRHTGTYSAQEAAQRMCGTESMVDVVQAYQDWAKGAFERLMADGLACQEQIVAATGALTSPPLSPSEKGTEPARVEAKAPLRAKVT
jgi:Phasin protein